jgi:hypothetical protein
VADASHAPFMTKPALHRKTVAVLSQEKQSGRFFEKKLRKKLSLL